MPKDAVYYAMVAMIVLVTFVTSFAVAFTQVRFHLLLAYVAGLVCGIAALGVEEQVVKWVSWNEPFYVLLLPIVGMAAGAAWRSKKRLPLIASVVLVAGALYGVVMSTLSLPAHVNVPFEAGTKGSVAEVEFRVATTMTYTFYLDLHFTDGHARNRVEKLAGTAVYRDGRQIDTGLAIPVRLRVERIGESGAFPILDNVFTDHDREGYTVNFYSKIVTRIRLEPGRYRVRIEALENILELEGIPVHFDIHVRGG